MSLPDIPSLPIPNPSSLQETYLFNINNTADAILSVGQSIQGNVTTTFGLMNSLLKDLQTDLPIIVNEIKRLKGIERSIFNLVLMVSITLALGIFALIFYIYGKTRDALS
jgi:hypothetical protein